MTFARFDADGKQIRNQVTVDCSDDEIITEQSHKDEVNINNIVRRHGGNMELIQKTSMLQRPDFQFDEMPGNDFQEAMLIVTKAQQTFESLPSGVRKQFNNNPAEFLDYVQNPENIDGMIKLGLAERLPAVQPVQVEITNPPVQQAETPTE